MSGEEFDPCECYWNHESAMRRLLGLLRGSQSYCTDNECFGELPGPEDSPPQNNPVFLLVLAWMAVAFLLFFMRPASLRNRGDVKPANDNQGPNNQPPPAVD
ncbi:Small integral membrane protein 14 [Nymphon striatum]|nr:Small integral membrane protein 14 [Nymphon striatum]